MSSGHNKSGSTDSKNAKVGKASNASTTTMIPTTTPTTTTTTASHHPTTDYQRFDTPMDRIHNIMNHCDSYDSNDDSYYSNSGNHSQRSYTSYNYMSTSIRDRIYNNTNTAKSRSAPSLVNTTTNTTNTSNTPLSLLPFAQQDPDQTSSLLTEEDQQRIQYLALRKFHIPGHTFTQDYIYW